MVLQEDNNGFVQFPNDNMFSRRDGKTFIYLVAFDSSDISNDKPYILSNIHINLPGNFITDDIGTNDRYFQEDESISMTTCICIGWNDNTFEFKEDASDWYATFRDLTHEGKKLYYSLKKLHNNKEVRILTFNNI